MTHGGDGKIYFGHPITIYNTQKESDLIDRIRKMFGWFDVENPNQKHHQEGYKRYKDKGERGMNYFFQEVLPKMDAGIFLPFEDGMFGTGVFEEAQFIFNNNKKIYEISYHGKIDDLFLDSKRGLSIGETLKRVNFGKDDEPLAKNP